MPERRSPSVLIASLVLCVGLTSALAACSGGGDSVPSSSATRSASPTASASPSTSSSASPSGVPSDDQTGSADDGTGTGTGNGSGVETPSSVDFTKITAQGVAAAGGGTVVSLSGSGDSWTVVVAGPDGSQTQSVVSATLDRVTSGPFPKDADAATKAANVARAAALRTTASDAAGKAVGAVSGSTLSSLVLGGSGSAPVWTATVTAAGAPKTVTINGVSGATTAS